MEKFDEPAARDAKRSEGKGWTAMGIQASETAARKVARMIRGVRVAMLTTTAPDGALHSRPMAAGGDDDEEREREKEFDGELWFFTKVDSGKVDEILHDSEVNLSYVSFEDHRYVSLSGRAMVVRDQEKIDALWSPMYRPWFAKGLDEPGLALLRVNVRTARYWDALVGEMIELSLSPIEADRGVR